MTLALISAIGLHLFLLREDTPGLENSVYDNTPDEDAPFIIQMVALPPNFLEIYFSEGMDSSSLVNASIYTAPGLTIQNIYVASSPAQSMIIEFNENIETGTLYSISVQNAQDCWLNSNEMFSTFAMTEIGTCRRPRDQRICQ